MELQKAANATNKISQNWPAGRAGQCQTRQMLAVVFYVHELHNLVLFSSRVINVELITRQIFFLKQRQELCRSIKTKEYYLQEG